MKHTIRELPYQLLLYKFIQAWLTMQHHNFIIYSQQNNTGNCYNLISTEDLPKIFWAFLACSTKLHCALNLNKIICFHVGDLHIYSSHFAQCILVSKLQIYPGFHLSRCMQILMYSMFALLSLLLVARNTDIKSHEVS